MQKLKIQNGCLVHQKQVPSPHFSQRPSENDISLLVIHYISLPPEEFGGNFIDLFFKANLTQLFTLILKKLKIFEYLPIV